MQSAPLVSVSRGSQIESVHCGSIAVCDTEGKLVAVVGDPERLTYLRSSAKPFQAMAVVETGAVDRFAMTEAEIALIASSHSGEPRHTRSVAGLLARAGLAADDLQCGAHPPLHAHTRATLEASGQPPTALHHNCSGKHCGMLCACVHQGWDARTYLRPDHPMQRRNLALIADAASLPARDIAIAIDGCGVPTFGMPLRSFATAFARLARHDTLGSHDEAGRRVATAMLAHPEMVAGEGRFDTALMERAGGRVLVKSGAEGCCGISLPERGWGIALKIEDGNARAVPSAAVATLRAVNVLTEADESALADFARPPIRNYRGEIVGEIAATFRLDLAR
ncbi:MAG TPA: asparaginase [Chloroflexota bacterium]|nr:asparaginase [Chloroflexota bacterium]